VGVLELGPPHLVNPGLARHHDLIADLLVAVSSLSWILCHALGQVSAFVRCLFDALACLSTTCRSSAGHIGYALSVVSSAEHICGN